MRGKDPLNWPREARLWLRSLKKSLPIICSSDEFPQFPLVDEEDGSTDRWDLLNQDSMDGLIRLTENFLERSKKFSESGDLEEEIDHEVATGLARQVLAELREYPLWRYSPLLYLRVILVGLGRQYDRLGSGTPDGRGAWFLLEAGRLLKEAVENLREVSGLEKEMAGGMVGSLALFMREAWPGSSEGEVFEKGLKKFTSFLDDSNTPFYFRPAPRAYLDLILSRAYGREVEPERLLEDLEDSRPDRVDSYSGGFIPEDIPGNEEGLVDLYRREITAIQNFLDGRDIGFPRGVALPRVMITPAVWHSFRSSASYVAPGRFFIAPPSRDTGGLMEFHREYSFISAHEAFPGHHLLDTLRMGHPRLWRRVAESPFYYEGWTCYVERLLTEEGYREGEDLEAVIKRRRAWRWARAWVDLNLHLGRTDLDGAAEMLSRSGLSPPQARRQVQRYALSPGMQMCYFFGEREVVALRRKWRDRLGLDGFHRHFLEGGQLPFETIDRRLARIGKS
jgi:hypothetical protein